MEIKIEKGVPIPERKTSKSKYPFSEMQVGYSFFVEDYKPSSLYQIAMIWRKQALVQWRFKAIKEGDGCRIWRVE